MTNSGQLALKYTLEHVQKADHAVNPPDVYHSFLAGYEAAQEESNSPKKLDSWISVKNRMPDVGHRILVTHRASQDYANLKVMEARRISDDEYCLPEDYCILADYVDYWMPLPEPPKEEI